VTRNHRLRSPLLGLLSLTAIACSTTIDGPEGPGTPVPVTRLRPEPFSFTYNSGLRTAERLVIRDEATWQATWAAISGNITPAPPRPAIDFEREMLVVAALGERSTGGYSIIIESASATGEALTVRIHSTAPGSTCVTTQAFTQPVDVARLPRMAGPVSFVDDASVADCR
jgi:hypothetical protein